MKIHFDYQRSRVCTPWMHLQSLHLVQFRIRYFIFFYFVETVCRLLLVLLLLLLLLQSTFTRSVPLFIGKILIDRPFSSHQKSFVSWSIEKPSGTIKIEFVAHNVYDMLRIRRKSHSHTHTHIYKWLEK